MARIRGNGKAPLSAARYSRMRYVVQPLPLGERTEACAMGQHGACQRNGCACLHHYPADRQGAQRAMASMLGATLRRTETLGRAI